MAEPKSRGWINLIAGLVGLLLIATGWVGLMAGFGVWDSFISVLGFIIAGWAALDYRRFRRGTPESEVDGGKLVE